MSDQFGWLKAIGTQGVTGINNINDAIGQAHEEGQLHRTIKFNNLGLNTLASKVTARHIDELSRHAQASVQRWRIFSRSDHQFALSYTQIQWLVNTFSAVLHQYIFTRNTNISPTVLQVRRHIRGTDNDDLDVITAGVKNQFA